MNKNSDSLWLFLVGLYAKPGVEELCLHLQDVHGANVNILLWAQWLQWRRTALTGELCRLAKNTVAPWSEGVVKPLRSARRAAKQLSGRDDGGFVERLKQMELHAERQVAQSLAGLYQQLESEQKLTVDALAPGQNLRSYLNSISVDEIASSWISTLSQPVDANQTVGSG